MSDITEQEVIQHAAARGLTLWDLISSLTQAVNDCNKSTDEFRASALAGKVEAITIGIDALLTTSAKAVFDQKIEQIRAAKCSELAFDNMMLNDLKIPKFGEKYA